MKKLILTAAILSATISAATLPLSAQTPSAPKPTGNANAMNGVDSFPDPGAVKYAPRLDPNAPSPDLYLSDWQGSMPRAEHGSLVLRDILTHGDNFNPVQRGAVLSAINFLALGRLAPGYITTPEKMTGRQEVYFILSGEGEITAAGATQHLRKDIAVLIPAGLEFSLHNTGTADLTMYVICEPTPEHFVPKTAVVVRDESAVHQRTPGSDDPYIVGGASGHWAHIVRELFSPADGLATLQSVITVTINPHTMGEPHPHVPGHEEIWAEITGHTLAMLGTSLRPQDPGMAYMLRPDGYTVHSNINASDEPAKFLYFAHFPPTMDYIHAVPPAIPAPK
jgi:mannose-6-phosphate isomerase-like protein (cupin superfamily)